MARNPEIRVKKPKRGEVEAEATIEERILAAAELFRSTKSGDIEREVVAALEDNYDKLLFETIGLKRDHWRDSKLTFSFYNTEIGQGLRKRCETAARNLIDSIDFDSVELSEAQVRAIKSAYQSELKEHVVYAARQAAKDDAINIARKVLGIELKSQGDDGNDS